MRRLSNNAIEIEPYDPCFCGRDKKVKFCHPLPINSEIPRPSPSNCRPPATKTGFSHAKCYARLLNDCSPDLSGEHLFSEVMLNLISGPDGKVVRKGYPWQEEHKVQSLTPSNCTANVLCKRHNNALSPIDETAGRFLKAILCTPSFLQNHDLRVLMISGDDLERWMLKTLCAHIIAVKRFGGDWEPRIEWLNVLWGMEPFPKRCGLYFNHEIGTSSQHVSQLGLRVLTTPSVPGPTGVIIQLAGHEFALTMIAPAEQQAPDSAVVPKFYRPSDFVFSYGKSEVVYSFGWADEVPPHRIALSWAPSM